MKRLVLWLILVSVMVVVAIGLTQGDQEMSASDYAREYGGQASIYAGILSDDRCDRLWELHTLDVEPGYRIAAGDRYNEVC